MMALYMVPSEEYKVRIPHIQSRCMGYAGKHLSNIVNLLGIYVLRKMKRDEVLDSYWLIVKKSTYLHICKIYP